MILKDSLEAQGTVLFRWRSFLPLLMLPVAAAAAFASSGFPDGHADLPAHLYDLFCMALSFGGLLVRAYTVASAAPRTSGRNTREQRADFLNTSGAYSVVRNPLYVGNFLMFLGMLLFIKSWWLVLIAGLAYVLYYERIVLAEEKFLVAKFGQVYVDWARHTPAMIPDFRQWRRPERKISLKTILRREYNGFFLLVVAFYLLEWGDRILFNLNSVAPMTLGQAPGLYWSSFFVFGTFVFITLRTLKKYTDILQDT